MTNVFGATSTTDEVLSGINLQGKRILVTGVSAGLGVETARSLAEHGAHVVGTARDLTKAEAATAQVRTDAAKGGGGLELVELDLANLKSVRGCADGLLAKDEPFDVIIANAGVMATPLGHTVDGFETQFGTNHLGHFVFVNRIAPLLRTGSRLINVSSSGHRYSNVDLDDPNFERTPYEPFVAYGRSKTANILFAVAFDERRRGRVVALVRPVNGRANPIRTIVTFCGQFAPGQQVRRLRRLARAPANQLQPGQRLRGSRSCPHRAPPRPIRQGR